MRFAFRPMTEEDARAMAVWRYPDPHGFYDLDADDLRETLAELPAYHAATDERGELVGFFSCGPGAQVPGGHQAGLYPPDALDIGLGLRPDLTGRGLGAGFVAAGLAHLRATTNPPPTRFRLSVAAFNTRAIRAYERAGFRAGVRFPSPVRGVDTDFLLMTADGPIDALDEPPHRLG